MIGVNCLGWLPGQVFEAVSPAVAGVWIDNVLIDESEREQPDAQHLPSRQLSEDLLDVRRRAGRGASRGARTRCPPRPMPRPTGTPPEHARRVL